MNDNESLAHLNKTKVDWMSDPTAVAKTDILSIPSMDIQHRKALVDIQQKAMSGGDEGAQEKARVFQSFNSLYQKAYGSLPSKDDLQNNVGRARDYYKAAASFGASLDSLMANGKKTVIPDETVASLSRSAIVQNPVMINGGKEIAAPQRLGSDVPDDDVYFIERGLQSAGIPVTPQTTADMKAFLSGKSGWNDKLANVASFYGAPQHNLRGTPDE